MCGIRDLEDERADLDVAMLIRPGDPSGLRRALESSCFLLAPGPVGDDLEVRAHQLVWTPGLVRSRDVVGAKDLFGVSSCAFPQARVGLAVGDGDVAQPRVPLGGVLQVPLP